MSDERAVRSGKVRESGRSWQGKMAKDGDA